MQIREWMTKDVITVTAQTTIFKAAKLLKEYSIRRLPVVDEKGKLIGIISDRDVKAATPSRATTLDMYELMYLLSEIKVRDAMSSPAISIGPEQTVEMAALIMEEHGFGGLPVVDAENMVVGIITDHDVFKVLVAITGIRRGGMQLAFEVNDEPGTIRPILDYLRNFKASVFSLLTSSSERDNKRRVYIRIKSLDPEVEEQLINELIEKFSLLYFAKDKVHEFK